MSKEREIVLCPWCKLDCDGLQELRNHVAAQHPKERDSLDEDELQRLAAWHQGKTNVIDI